MNAASERPPAWDAAVRIDADRGIREEMGFFGSGRDRLFGSTHLPLRGASSGVVVCSPVLSEFVQNYRREVLLGRSLASAGVAVQRFHYRGSGNSDGEVEDLTFETMQEDAVAAAGWLVERTGVDRVAFTGTRVGASVAAAAAADFEGTPLATWEPVPDPAAYFKEVFRGRLVFELKKGTGADGSTRPPEEELRSSGLVDILGYPVCSGLYDSLMSRSLVPLLGERPRPLLVIQMGGAGGLRKPSRNLVSQLQERGFAVDVELVPHPETWWFGGAPEIRENQRDRDEAAVEATTRWLDRHLKGSEEGT